VPPHGHHFPVDGARIAHEGCGHTYLVYQSPRGTSLIGRTPHYPRLVPRISSFYGIVIAMYYDDHAPPHFHARYGELKPRFSSPLATS